MRISAVNMFSNVYQHKNVSNNHNNQRGSFVQKPICDSVYFGSSYEDEQMKILQNRITTLVQPYLTENKGDYLKLGRMCYDMQEKSKVYQEREQSMFYKDCDARKDDKIANAEKVLEPFEKYYTNIRTFDRTSEMMKNSPFVTQEIRDYIENNKEKMIANEKEFQKFNATTVEVANLEESMSNDLYMLRQTNFEEAKGLQDKEFDAKFRIMISPCRDALEIVKGFDELKKDYDKLLLYDLDKRIGKLSERIDDFKEDIKTHKDAPQDIKNCLRENKKYYSTTKSVEEINKSYDEIEKKMDETISQYADKIDDCVKSSDTSNIDFDVINTTLQDQEEINNRLNDLIQQEKVKYYEQSYKKFQDENGGTYWQKF